jgi:hypothetical protein
MKDIAQNFDMKTNTDGHQESQRPKDGHSRHQEPADWESISVWEPA